MTRTSTCYLGCLEKTSSHKVVLSINYCIHKTKPSWTMVLVLTAVIPVQS